MKILAAILLLFMMAPTTPAHAGGGTAGAVAAAVAASAAHQGCNCAPLTDSERRELDANWAQFYREIANGFLFGLIIALLITVPLRLVGIPLILTFPFIYGCVLMLIGTHPGLVVSIIS